MLLAVFAVAADDPTPLWTVVYLHPSPTKESDAFSASGGRQGGYKTVRAYGRKQRHPILWDASGDEYVDLLPEGMRMGVIYGMDGEWQVGEIRSLSEGPFATLWHGTAESLVDLTPGFPYICAYARAVAGAQQVGAACSWTDGMTHAALWRGTPESFIDLHPAVARWSEAYATDGERQGGRVDIDDPDIGIHAGLWRGSAESFIDRNPEGARESVILGMAPGVQMGWGIFEGRNLAVLWHGTPESAVVMNPADAYHSQLYATTGTFHAGYITHGFGSAEAGLWIGDDPESFINLQDYFVPDGYYASVAKAISEHKGRLYVVGSAASPRGRHEAILWIGRVPRTTGPLRRPRP